MHATSDTLALIGNTPLVRLKGPSEAAGCEIFGKCEFANPGASVKDRAALFIVEDAEERGLLQPGGTIVEGTAGNTGIGLALVANAKGYKTIIVMPETQSREKMDTLRALGAELVLVPAAPYSNPGAFRAHLAPHRRGDAQRDLGQPVRQYRQSPRAYRRHRRGDLGRRWTGGSTGSPARSGTGGTLAGVGLGLKAKDEKVCIALSDPHGAALYEYYACGELQVRRHRRSPKGSGRGGSPPIWKARRSTPSSASRTPKGMNGSTRLLDEEGLCLGLSSGINVAGAVRLAKQLGPGKPHRDDPVRHRIPLPFDALQRRLAGDRRGCPFRSGLTRA